MEAANHQQLLCGSVSSAFTPVFVVTGERLQIFDQVGLLPDRKAERHTRIIVVYNVEESCESPIVVEAALGMSPESIERRGSILPVGRAVGLKVVHAYFRPTMQIPAGLRVQGLHVTGAALAFAREDFVTPFCGLVIETVRRR